MDTLVGFMTFTKGIEYLIAIGFILAFIAFWQLTYARGKGSFIVIAIPAYLALGVIILLSTCLAAMPR